MNDWQAALYLSLLPRVGPIQYRQLLSLAEPAQLLGCSVVTLQQWGVPKSLQPLLADPDEQRLTPVLEWLAGQPHRHLLMLNQANYPLPLAATDDAPPVLYVEGDGSLLHAPQLAVVGSRHATPPARALTEHWCRQLAAAGLVITSGLALGIDSCAHRGALAPSGGQTIAVMANGLGQIYPRRHQALAADIIARGGALVSENPPWIPPRAGLFPRRNRIISGLSYGVLVVTAGLPSGTLTTARAAAQQGREVWVVPGAVGDPLKQGCHWLIKQGAALVDQPDDILWAWPTPLTRPVMTAEQPQTCGLTPFSEQKSARKLAGTLPNSKLLDNVGDKTVSVDDLVVLSGLPIEQVLSELLELELQGKVASVAGGYIRMREG